ncbi:MAG: SRPBCC family protein [Solirubrobacteraceae bacterium]
MPAVGVVKTFAGTVAEAERCWYETAGWHLWVDGLDRVLAVDGDWPAAGSSVTWQSGPAGRGRVVERVIAYEPLRGQALVVDDDSISGRQSVAFAGAAERVQVSLTLEYKLVHRTIVSPVVDVLFIRRAMATSLGATLGRFGAELEATRAGRRA